MTKDIVKKKVRDILDGYLEVNNHRKTSERYAILDAVYDIGGHFSLDELGAELEARNFRVSRATLYNTMRLFIELRLVVRHRFIGQTKYEACYANEDHIHQICTVCGKVTEIESPEIADAIKETKLYRFRKDGFSALYLWYMFPLSGCYSRQRNKPSRHKKQDKNSQKSK